MCEPVSNDSLIVEKRVVNSYAAEAADALQDESNSPTLRETWEAVVANESARKRTVVIGSNGHQVIIYYPAVPGHNPTIAHTAQVSTLRPVGIDWGSYPWVSAELDGGSRMKRVLLAGFDAAMVDFSDPALPPGMTAEKIHVGVKLALADMARRGWAAENCFINPDETAVPTVERRLAGNRYDCVVVGAGVRRRHAIDAA